MSFLHNPTARNIQPLWIPVAVLGGLLLVSLVVQLTLAWLSYDRILPASRHVDHLDQLQQTLTQVETTLTTSYPIAAAYRPSRALPCNKVCRIC